MIQIQIIISKYVQIWVSPIWKINTIIHIWPQLVLKQPRNLLKKRYTHSHLYLCTKTREETCLDEMTKEDICHKHDLISVCRAASEVGCNLIKDVHMCWCASGLLYPLQSGSWRWCSAPTILRVQRWATTPTLSGPDDDWSCCFLHYFKPNQCLL